MEPDRLQAELEEMDKFISSRSTEREPPLTTLQILNRSHRERAWHKTLAYFLSPQEPHGYSTEVLDSFLGTVQDELGFGYTEFSLGNTNVYSEVDTPEGRVDLVITSGSEWFLCVELKVDSTEGNRQTERYVRTDTVAGRQKSEFERGGYVYLSKEDGDTPDADEFMNVSWKEVIEGFEGVLSENRGVYPARSQSQLSEFVDTVKEETGMSEDSYLQEQMEKAELYAEYREAIEEARDSFTYVVEEEQDRWSQRFVTEFKPEGWDKNWNCDPRDKGQIYRDGWRLDEGLKPCDSHTDSRTQLQFVHFIREVEEIRGGELRFETKWPGGDEIRDAFDEWFVNHGRDNIELALRGIETSPGKIVYTRKIYEFDVTGFPESYYETLAEAFEEHQEVADILSDGLETVLSDYR